MTRRAKPPNPPTPGPKLEVPDTPIDPTALPGDPRSAETIVEAAALAGYNQAEQKAAVAALKAEERAEAELMVADLLNAVDVSWVEAPDLYESLVYIQDLVNLAEHGNSWQADERIRLHPRGAPQSLIDDLRAVADAQIRQYAKTCAKNRGSMDSAVVAYLARNPKPLPRSRGRKASERTAYETLKLAAKVKLRIDAGKSVEEACAPDDPTTPGDSRALKAYYAFKDTPEIDLMAALLMAGVENF